MGIGPALAEHVGPGMYWTKSEEFPTFEDYRRNQEAEAQAEKAAAAQEMDWLLDRMGKLALEMGGESFVKSRVAAILNSAYRIAEDRYWMACLNLGEYWAIRCTQGAWPGEQYYPAGFTR